MVIKRQFTPVLSAALGAALCYYGRGLPGEAGRIFLFVTFLSIGWGSLFLVLGESPDAFFAVPALKRRFMLWRRLVLAFSAGLVLGTGAASAKPGEPAAGLEAERISAVWGRLAEDPRSVRDGRGMGSLDLSRAESGAVRTSARGRLRVYFPEESLPRIREFGRGSLLYVEGNCVRSGEGGQLYFRARSVHVTQAAPPIEQMRTVLRRRLTGLAESVSGGRPWSGLSLALLLGIKDNLEGSLAEAYRGAGCSHVLALSGMHLAIVSALVVFLLKRPLGLKAAALTGAVFVLVYVFIVGPQPSLNRAAIMYLLGTLTVLGSLPRDPLNLLGLSFLVQIAVDPGSGTSVSFILSYLALGGILFTGETLHELWRGKIPELLLAPLSASLGAFIAVAPVTVYWFGTLRPSGIAAGLIVVPVATVFMIGSILVFILYGIFPALGSAAGEALSLVYWVQDKVVRGAAALPGISPPGPASVLAAALTFTLFVLCLARKARVLRNRVAPFSP